MLRNRQLSILNSRFRRHRLLPGSLPRHRNQTASKLSLLPPSVLRYLNKLLSPRTQLPLL